ncbi:hypothetical protein ABZ532_04390 [Streptomyces sp. NPDC019396]|uniref:hypothetical protein n=1 Tax=Streptomyces sp. NPDC019396 TaxID=3154687 RepID=UPI0033C52EB9
MSSKRRVRRLVIGDAVWLWSQGHGHPDGVCRQILSLTREGTAARLRIVFKDGPGLIVSGGYWHDGLVARSQGEALNLHEPGVVRQFLEAAQTAGVSAPAEVDGWTLYDAIARADESSPSA